MQRLATAALTVPLALAAVFLLEPRLFLLVVLAAFEMAAFEFIALARTWAPRAPLFALPVLVAVASLALAQPLLLGQPLGETALLWLVFALAGGVGVGVLLWRTPIEQAVPAIGLLAFGTLYLALPVATLARLQAVDPWLVFLLFAIVWLGDTAAYYVGSRFGRRPLAPVVSPRKTWEGAVASFVTALAAALVWSLWRGGAADWTLVGLAGATSIAAQLGDLVESLFKRAAGLKDSGRFLPGHGGMLDRLDAMIVAAPAWWLGLTALGYVTGSGG